MSQGNALEYVVVSYSERVRGRPRRGGWRKSLWDKGLRAEPPRVNARFLPHSSGDTGRGDGHFTGNGRRLRTVLPRRPGSPLNGPLRFPLCVIVKVALRRVRGDCTPAAAP